MMTIMMMIMMMMSLPEPLEYFPDRQRLQLLEFEAPVAHVNVRRLIFRPVFPGRVMGDEYT